MCNVIPPSDAEDADLIRHLDARFKGIKQAEEQAYARGYADAMSSIHAWKVARDVEGERFVWTCRCGHVVFQRFGSAPPAELVEHPRGE